MAKKTLEEIKEIADEYAQVAKQIARIETARERVMAPVVERHAEEMAEATGSHDKRIAKLQKQADELRGEVIAFVADKKKTYSAESGLATFGVEVGTKAGPRIIDRTKFIALCKKKGVDIWNIAKIMVEKADELLGKKEVAAISEPSSVPTRVEYLKLKD
jgi:DNA-binding transcriptional MerR regulator